MLQQIIIGYGDSINLCRMNLVQFILTTCSIAPRLLGNNCLELNWKKTLPFNFIIFIFIEIDVFVNLDRVFGAG